MLLTGGMRYGLFGCDPEGDDDVDDPDGTGDNLVEAGLKSGPPPIVISGSEELLRFQNSTQ